MDKLVVTHDVLDVVQQIAERAGDVILQVYLADESFKVNIKADASPVTEADIAANNVIRQSLLAAFPEVPVLSEEDDIPAYSKRKAWQQYWLVDPLDGTKEFISRNGQFTVNIALIDEGRPVLGVVYQPVNKTCYCGIPGKGAYKIMDGRKQSIHTRSLQNQIQNGGKVGVLASRHHDTEQTEQVINTINKLLAPVERISVGSSLKFCMLAEGQADFYPRYVPTCEWDVAAAQAVLEAAGGAVVTQNGKTFSYNQKESLVNSSFFAFADGSCDWLRFS